MNGTLAFALRRVLVTVPVRPVSVPLSRSALGAAGVGRAEGDVGGSEHAESARTLPTSAALPIADPTRAM